MLPSDLQFWHSSTFYSTHLTPDARRFNVHQPLTKLKNNIQIEKVAHQKSHSPAFSPHKYLLFGIFVVHRGLDDNPKTYIPLESHTHPQSGCCKKLTRSVECPGKIYSKLDLLKKNTSKPYLHEETMAWDLTHIKKFQFLHITSPPY